MPHEVLETELEPVDAKHLQGDVVEEATVTEEGTEIEKDNAEEINRAIAKRQIEIRKLMEEFELSAAWSREPIRFRLLHLVPEMTKETYEAYQTMVYRTSGVRTSSQANFYTRESMS